MRLLIEWRLALIAHQFEPHRKAVEEAKEMDGSARSVRAFNLIAKKEGREERLFDQSGATFILATATIN
jgi:hypothetical protein